MNLSNREELIATMQQAQQPNPEAQQMQQAVQQAQMEFQQSQTAALSAQAQESQARATKYAIEAQLAPEELEIDKINAITRNLQAGDQDDKEFERRIKIADALLKEKQIEGKRPNAPDNQRNEQPTSPNQRSVQPAVRQIGLVGEPGQGNGGTV
jgi:signal recognition particle GTPase